jgi:hypothetical protein
MIMKKTILAAAIVAAAAFAAVPAKADIDVGFGFAFDGVGISIGDFYDQMEPWEVRRMLRHRGYHDIDFSDTHGRYYKLTAEKHGDDYFMKVDSYTGDIVYRNHI